MKNLKIIILLIGYCTVSGLYASQQQQKQALVEMKALNLAAVMVSSSSSSSSSSAAAASSNSSSSSSASSAAASTQSQATNNKASAEHISSVSPYKIMNTEEFRDWDLTVSCWSDSVCYDRVWVLLDEGANVNSFYMYNSWDVEKDQYTCLRSAIDNGAESIARLLMQWSANPYFTRDDETFCVSNMRGARFEKLSNEFILDLKSYAEQYTKKYGNKPPA